MIEEYRDIIGYEGRYQISDYGNVKSLYDDIIMKPFKNYKGYFKIRLRKNKKKKNYRIHRLVGIMFIPNPDNKPEINHIDGNKINNHVTNLEWNTQEENYFHSVNVLGNSITKKVIQMDMDGNELNIYNSINEASKELNIPRENIRKCLIGERKSTYKFRFKLYE